MGSESKKGTRIAGVIAAVIAATQVVFLVRYVNRLPDDSLGIWLSVVTIVAWVVAAVLFLGRSRSERGKGG